MKISNMTLEAINNMRRIQGLELLTELPKDESDSGGETPEQIEAKRVAAEAEAARIEAEKNKKPDANTEENELSDEELLKLLGKRGITAVSIEALKTPPTPPDPAKVAEQREADELAYALSKGLFNKKDYDSFLHDSQDPQDLVYAQYHAEAKAEDKDLTDEDIQAEFLSKFGLDAEPGTRKHKRGIKEINTIAESLLKQKYGKIYDAKSAFSTHEKDVLTTKETDTKVSVGVPVYKKDVEDIFTDLKKIPFKFSDTESVDIPVMQEYLDELKDAFLKPEHAKNKILSGYKKETLKEEVFAAFLYKNFPYLAKEIANQHLLKHSAGTKGIPLLGGLGKKEGDTIELTPAQKTLAEIIKKEKEKSTVTN
jgi:hypothetical protein